jgi:uncharacterized protein YkwD
MKKIIFPLIFLFLITASHSQEWTTPQLDSANTAKETGSLTDVEKATIQYINLARLYPQQFVTNELENYAAPARYGDYLKNSPYKKSLINDLRKMKPVKALHFDKDMYELATCFAREIGKAGSVTHKRKKCPYGYMAECCSFGMDTGKDIAMQWLIDDKSPGLGHRINCLNREYSVIGIALQNHKVYSKCAVADLK